MKMQLSLIFTIYPAIINTCCITSPNLFSGTVTIKATSIKYGSTAKQLNNSKHFMYYLEINFFLTLKKLCLIKQFSNVFGYSPSLSHNTE